MGAAGAVLGAALQLLQQRPALPVVANGTVSRARALGERLTVPLV